MQRTISYTEEDLLPISALSHLVFCERRTALIHLEQIWTENIFTAEGRVLHERAHEETSENRIDTRVSRGLRIHSLRLGIAGIMDVVEFIKSSDSTKSNRVIQLTDQEGLWKPLPVEYKRGKPKLDNCDKVQLCAQALCLEEMLDVTIEFGNIFYGKPRRRMTVKFDQPLRKETEDSAARLHELYKRGTTPPPNYSKKCLNCSLVDTCKPKATERYSSASKYVENILRDIKLSEQISRTD